MIQKSGKFTHAGDIGILKSYKKLALFCSNKCPGEIIIKTYDFMRTLMDVNDIAVISGFHSPMEQECLNILLNGDVPVIICPARSIKNANKKRI